MHPSAQWHAISTPPSQRIKDPLTRRGQTGDPMCGELDTWALEALCTILPRHTATPHTCYFALWEGRCGWRHGHSPGSTFTSVYTPDGVRPEVQPPQPAPAEW